MVYVAISFYTHVIIDKINARLTLKAHCQKNSGVKFNIICHYLFSIKRHLIFVWHVRRKRIKHAFN